MTKRLMVQNSLNVLGNSLSLKKTVEKKKAARITLFNEG